jgi:hypothetical protein
VPLYGGRRCITARLCCFRRNAELVGKHPRLYRLDAAGWQVA